MMKDTEVLNNIIDPFYWKFLRELSKMEYNFEQAIISLSPDQLKCKKWLADELKKIRGSFLPFDNTIIQLYGGWLGYPLIDFLEDSIGIGLLENIDLDKKALKAFAKMCYYKNKKYNWPLYMAKKPINIKKGDGVIYKGREITHSRKKFKEKEPSWHHQIFLHYVDLNGPFVNLQEENR